MTDHNADAGWRDRYESGSKRNIDFVTQSSMEVDPLYTAADLADHDTDKRLGYPGAYPFTRGIHPTMYRGRLWTMRQFSGFGTAEDTNSAIAQPSPREAPVTNATRPSSENNFDIAWP